MHGGKLLEDVVIREQRYTARTVSDDDNDGGNVYCVIPYDT